MTLREGGDNQSVGCLGAVGCHILAREKFQFSDFESFSKKSFQKGTLNYTLESTPRNVPQKSSFLGLVNSSCPVATGKVAFPQKGDFWPTLIVHI